MIPIRYQFEKKYAYSIKRSGEAKHARIHGAAIAPWRKAAFAADNDEP